PRGSCARPSHIPSFFHISPGWHRSFACRGSTGNTWGFSSVSRARSDSVAERFDADIIVVGGGPAGAATAWALSREGVDVLVLDRARFPRDKICAEYLSPQASRILADMGVLEEIERSSPAHLAGMSLRAPNGLIANGEFAANHGFRGFRDKGLAIRRTILDVLVLRGAQKAGARVEEGVRVTDLARLGSRISGVTAITPDGSTRAFPPRDVLASH